MKEHRDRVDDLKTSTQMLMFQQNKEESEVTTFGDETTDCV